MFRVLILLGVGLGLALSGERAEARGPYAIENNGWQLVPGGVRRGQGEALWNEVPSGLITSAAYDLDGNSTDVGQGKGNNWEILSAGPDQIYIRAASGKLKRWFLVVEDGRLKLSQKSQTWYVNDPKSGR